MNVILQKNLIEHQTEKAYLIRFPKKSNLRGHKMWFPKSLTYPYRNDENPNGLLKLFVPDGFDIRVFKTSEGFNISHDELKTNMQTIEYEDFLEVSYKRVVEPKPVDFESVSVRSELQR